MQPFLIFLLHRPFLDTYNGHVMLLFGCSVFALNHFAPASILLETVKITFLGRILYDRCQIGVAVENSGACIFYSRYCVIEFQDY